MLDTFSKHQIITEKKHEILYLAVSSEELNLKRELVFTTDKGKTCRRCRGEITQSTNA